MITLLFILLKFSLTIMVLWVFYKIFLERLTFFVSNRFFFLGGISTAFFIAIGRFELTDSLFNKQFNSENLGQYVPSIQAVSQQFFNPFTRLLPLANTLLVIYGIGVLCLGLNLAIQYLSYLKLKRGARLIEIHGQKVYVVARDISPFSFGKSIFISEHVTDNPEIEKILLHEAIHIQQNHSVDILLVELVRVINWINPFAWLLKKSIQQNLEFLTDAGIINMGIDKKAYQYLLLHFSGNKPFSLVTNFNFYSLKTRISKMNQNESNRLQYAKFLLLIPVILVLMFVVSCINDQATDVTPKSKEMDELAIVKLKEKLSSPVIEIVDQNQLKKMDEKEILVLKSKLRGEALKLNLDTKDQPNQSLLLQKVGNLSLKVVEKTPPPPPPAMPEKQ